MGNYSDTWNGTGGDEAGTDEEERPLVGRCTECGNVYSIQDGADGELRPVGTDGECACGNDEFEPLGEQ